MIRKEEEKASTTLSRQKESFASTRSRRRVCVRVRGLAAVPFTSRASATAGKTRESELCDPEAFTSDVNVSMLLSYFE